MIFGFNTEVKCGDVVYHIQSEARQRDFLLQTQVFIKGRCMGKHQTAYGHLMSEADFSDEKMHELLKEQHRAFVVAAREGRIEDLLPGLHTGTASTASVAPSPVRPAAPTDEAAPAAEAPPRQETETAAALAASAAAGENPAAQPQAANATSAGTAADDAAILDCNAPASTAPATAPAKDKPADDDVLELS